MVPGQPGPNMRAAAFQAQQQNQREKSQGPSSIIMPIYTFGIVAFFVFTIVKIVMKKVGKTAEIPAPMASDPVFVEKVFKQTQADPKKKLGEFLKAADELFFGRHQNSYFLSFNRNWFGLHSGWKDHNASKSSECSTKENKSFEIPPLHFHTTFLDPQFEQSFLTRL